MEGVTGMMAWLGHVPGRCRRGVYGHADIDKPFFSYRGSTAEMEHQHGQAAQSTSLPRLCGHDLKPGILNSFSTRILKPSCAFRTASIEV